MADHKDAVRDKVGVYYKESRYTYRKNCEGCGKGYHSHRWQAHHVLPATCFGGLETFVRECLGVTDYNINKDYSMAGMPTLKAFLMYFRGQAKKADRGEENDTQLARWKKIRTYDYQKLIPVTFPGDYPCHQPVSFGHVVYNGDVSAKLEDDIWSKLMEKEMESDHPKPEDIKSKIEKVKDHFWSDLKARGSGAGGGGLTGVRENFLERNGKAKSGWWKPMSMANLPVAPTPPATYF